MVDSAVDRFYAKVKVDPQTSCHLWTAGLDWAGYGQFRPRAGDGNGASRKAHRYGYELVKGPIPRGLVLAHLCRNPRCVNPDHLEPVTQRENILRGMTYGAIACRTDTCRRGHAGLFYMTRRGTRRCRECERVCQRAADARRRTKRLERAEV